VTEPFPFPPPDPVDEPARRHDLVDIRRALAATVVGVALLLACVILAALAALGMPGVERTGRLTVADLFDLLKLAFAVVGGLGAVVALVMAYRRQRITEAENLLAEAAQAHRQRADELTWQQHDRAAADARHDATERRLTELYVAAADQLGSDRAPVRLAGLYALERLADTHPEHRQTVVNLLCAYLRMPWTPAAPDAPAATDHREEREVRLTAQRVLTAHLRDTETSAHWPDMDLDLTGATLDGWRLTGARVVGCRAAGARFVGTASFAGSVFAGPVDLTGAVFEEAAEVTGAFFNDAVTLDRATFRDGLSAGLALFAELSARDTLFEGPVGCRSAAIGRATFAGARFSGDATWVGATFADLVTFGRATFTAVSFEQTVFNGSAEFRATKFEGQADFAGASFNEAVTFDAARMTPAFSLEGARSAGPALHERVWPAGWRPGSDGTFRRAGDNK